MLSIFQLIISLFSLVTVHQAPAVKVVITPTPTKILLTPTPTLSENDVVNKVMYIEKQTYAAYQSCVAANQAVSCTPQQCTLPTPSQTQGNEGTYEKMLYQAKCELSCQNQGQTSCYNKYYGKSSTVPPPADIH